MTKTAEAKWRALIAAQEKSGLGVREFAASRGLAPGTMPWWRSCLRYRATPLVPVTVVDHDGAVRVVDGVGCVRADGRRADGAHPARVRRRCAAATRASTAMLTLPTSVRMYLARGATDMRKSIDGSSAVTKQVLWNRSIQPPGQPSREHSRRSRRLH